MPDSATLSVPVDKLETLEGAGFGPSSWREIGQDDIDVFARLTGDDNPIHVDADAAAKSPYGTRIAHGLLTLSCVVPMMREVFSVTGAAMGINYGLNRVRFPAAVPAGARIRIHGQVIEVTEIAGGWQTVVSVTYEVEGGEKPACVAEFVLRYYT
ncbi:MaoC family dehydratase [Phytoactinopolyspora halotolerans]|uniref:MaoC family dehydratase n=1 Tax=Phytoactinopolyspora halotolerans TaxID=1981512 RepID=A0A6L9S937_9ACTN|nr:MaoC family dehydratase [Phytoactinopolyspora halotolerans]NEE00480.1 MaoC family dehydratase [Phytoactinopolyspora halotolerans]